MSSAPHGSGIGRLITALTLFWLLALGVSWRIWGVEHWQVVGTLAAMAALGWWLGTRDVETRVYLSFSSIILLAATTMVGPVGAAIVGLIIATLQPERVPFSARVFNAVVTSTIGIIGGTTFLLTGGAADLSTLRGAGPIAMGLFVPMLLGNVAMALTNVVLVALVMRAAQRVPFGMNVVRLLATTAPAYAGYAMIAFLLVVLWRPAAFGPLSVLLILAPIIGARWAYLQYDEGRKAQRRALNALVSAIEIKAPHLAGHSQRVAELSAHMAEALGMRPHEVADVRTAAMLHDVGLVTLPTPLVRKTAEAAEFSPEELRLFESYPGRSLELVGGLHFLSGALEGIARHRDALHAGAEIRGSRGGTLMAHIVGVADEFDLSTQVGALGAPRLPPEPVIARLRSGGDAERQKVVDALVGALERLDTEEVPS